MHVSMAYNHGNNDCKVYVGNLPQDIKKSDLEDVFYKYGKLIEVDLHNARGPGAPFAFVEFEDPRYICILLASNWCRIMT